MENLFESLVFPFVIELDVSLQAFESTYPTQLIVSVFDIEKGRVSDGLIRTKCTESMFKAHITFVKLVADGKTSGYTLL